MPKVDITHTVALKNRPRPDAQLFRDLDTGEAVWEGVPVPEPVAPPPVEPMPEPEVVHRNPHHKKLHHG